jgi:hypothetical protein
VIGRKNRRFAKRVKKDWLFKKEMMITKRKEVKKKKMAPQVGFEPTTLRLTAECSTIELLRSDVGQYALHDLFIITF